MLISLINSLPLEQQRRILGTLANKLGWGGQKFVAKAFGKSPAFIRKGQHEAASGLANVPQTHTRGRKAAISKYPNLAKDITTIMDPRSMADPRLKNQILYSTMSVREAKQILQSSFGYNDLPSSSTIGRLLNSLGFSLKKVQKTKPLYRVEKTDEIFANVHRVRELAMDDPETAIISVDAKDKADIGEFSRGGRSRLGAKGLDHDYRPDAQLTPYGVLDVKTKSLEITMTDSYASADFYADCIESWIAKNSDGIKTLAVESDNGGEGGSQRTQFKKRIVEISAKYMIDILLVYYPPCLSKYNPIERAWASLERHWGGCMLGTCEQAVGYASTMSHYGKSPHVLLTEKEYTTGIVVSKGLNKIYESAMYRTEGIEKYSAVIDKDEAAEAVAAAASHEFRNSISQRHAKSPG
jgi:transposase